MLGILPYDRFCDQRDVTADRPFKAYHRPSPQMPLQPSYYAPFVNPSYLFRQQESTPNNDSTLSSRGGTDYHRLNSQYGGPQQSCSLYNRGSLGAFYNGSGSVSQISQNSSQIASNVFDHSTSTPPLQSRTPLQQFSRTKSGIADDSMNPMLELSNRSGLLHGNDSTQRLEIDMERRRLESYRGEKGNDFAQRLEVDMERRRLELYRGEIESSTIVTSTASSSGVESSSPDGLPIGRVGLITPIVAPSTKVSTSRSRSKKRPTAVPSELKDEHYWDKRKKNNESAKRSRESRRRQESVLGKHLACLEQEYVQLKADIAVFSAEIEQMRQYLMPAGSGVFEQSGGVVEQHHHHHHHHTGLL